MIGTVVVSPTVASAAAPAPKTAARAHAHTAPQRSPQTDKKKAKERTPGGADAAAARVAANPPVLAAGARTPRAAITNTYVVSTTTDGNNSTGTDCGSPCTLRGAVTAANADTSTIDAITVPAGTYVLDNGPLSIESDIVMTGADAASTIVTPNGESGSGIFVVRTAEDGTLPNFELSALTADGGSNEGGGNLLVSDGAATLRNVALTGGNAFFGGGAFVGTGATLWLENSTVAGNQAYIGGGIGNDGSATIVNSTIGGSAEGAGNSSEAYAGGGIATDGTMSIRDTTIQGNVLSGTNNNSPEAYGAGIVNGGTLEITRGAIVDNRIELSPNCDPESSSTCSAYAEGAGLFNDGAAVLDGVKVTGNTATITGVGGLTSTDYNIFGAGIANEYQLRLTNTTVDSNASSIVNAITSDSNCYVDYQDCDVNDGAGLYGGYNTTVIGGSISHNTATNGLIEGVAYQEDYTGSVDGTTIAGNTGTASADQDLLGAGVGFQGDLLSIKNTTIDGNSATTTGGGDTYGAGVYSESPLTLDAVTISNNVASTEDYTEGGVFTSFDDQHLTKVTITGNKTTASTIYGGVVSLNGDPGTVDHLAVTNNTVTVATSVNNGDDVDGGVLYSCCSTTFNALTVTGNTVTVTGEEPDVYGGVIELDDNVTIDGANISSNKVSVAAADIADNDVSPSSYVEGGVIAGYDCSDCSVEVAQPRQIGPQSLGRTIRGANVSDNAVSSTDDIYGGGIVDFGLLSMMESTVARNVSTTTADGGSVVGGGITSSNGYSRSGSRLDLRNVTVSENSASAAGAASFANGGGVFVESDGATITNSTISRNSTSGTATDVVMVRAATEFGSQSSGVYSNGSPVTFKNTIVAGNLPAATQCGDDPTAFNSAGNNLDSGNTCAFDGRGDLVNTDPMLGPLADNGGPGPTNALLAGSPAIDAGSTAGCPATDERGTTRPQGASCDIGAYEAVPAAPTTTPPPPAGPGTPPPTFTSGYREIASDGGVFTFGDREFHGSTGDIKLNKPVVGGATDKSTYQGYWLVASDGGVFTFNAPFFGSLAGQSLSAPAAEIEPTPSGQGYWIVLADGKVYTFGDANFYGDMSGKSLNKPIIGMSVTPDGKGYWLVGGDGGIFNFGNAGFYGSTGDMKLNAPIVDLAPSVDNQGYYLLGKDGGVFTFGNADFKGSTGDMKLNAPVIAMLVDPTGAGYWLAASDGGIFTFGNIPFLGSMGGTKLNGPVLDLIN